MSSSHGFCGTTRSLGPQPPKSCKARCCPHRRKRRSTTLQLSLVSFKRDKVKFAADDQKSPIRDLRTIPIFSTPYLRSNPSRRLDKLTTNFWTSPTTTKTTKSFKSGLVLWYRGWLICSSAMGRLTTLYPFSSGKRTCWRHSRILVQCGCLIEQVKLCNCHALACLRWLDRLPDGKLRGSSVTQLAVGDTQNIPQAASRKSLESSGQS